MARFASGSMKKCLIYDISMYPNTINTDERYEEI